MSGIKIIAKNKKAFFNYNVTETFEAGIVLLGPEVKSCRMNNLAVVDSYARVISGEVYLIGVNIASYKEASYMDHNPTRQRKLLLHKREIAKLKNAVETKGLTIIPIKFYFKRGRVKVELGLCKGKNLSDKRHSMREKSDNMAMKRAIAEHR